MSVESLGMKRRGKKKTRARRIEGTRVKSTRYRKTEFSSDRESLCNSISLTCVRTRTIYQPQARYTYSRNPAINQKSGHLFSSFADCEFARFIGADEPSPKEVPLRRD